MARGTISQHSCKHHKVSWKLGYDDLKSILEGQSLKAPFISLEDEVDVFLSCEDKDPDLKKMMDEFKEKNKPKEKPKEKK